MTNRLPRVQSNSIYRLPFIQSDSTQISPKPTINEKLYTENLQLSQTISQLNEQIQILSENQKKSHEIIKHLQDELIVIREHALNVEKEYQRLKFANGKVKKENIEYERQIRLLNQELRQLRGQVDKTKVNSGKLQVDVQKIRNVYYNQSQVIGRSRASSAQRSHRSHHRAITEYASDSVVQTVQVSKQPEISQAFRNMVQSARLRLKASRIPSEQIINVDQLKGFFAQRTLSQDDLNFFFQSFPFEIRDPKLMIETISMCKRQCKKTGKQVSGQALKNFVTKLFGQFVVLSEIEEVSILTNLHEKVYDTGKIILEELKIKALGNDFIQYKLFRDVLLQHQLSEDEVEFLVQKIILQSIDLQHLNYLLISQVLDLFNEPSYM